MPVDFANAQSIMYWGTSVNDSSTEQASKTPKQIAEEQYQNNVGAGLAGLLVILFVAMIILNERKK